MHPICFSDIDTNKILWEQNRSVEQANEWEDVVFEQIATLVDFRRLFARSSRESGRKGMRTRFRRQDGDRQKEQRKEQEEGQSTFPGWLEFKPTLGAGLKLTRLCVAVGDDSTASKLAKCVKTVRSCRTGAYRI